MSTPEFLTVPELAALLRLKDRKVYDLAASGEVPCCRATGKLLFPEKEVRAWLARSATGMDQPRPGVVLGSHDPLLDWALRQSGGGLASFYNGSSDGLVRFVAGEGVAAGVHLPCPQGGGWNLTEVARHCAGQNAVLVGFARRARGLVMRQPVAEVAQLAGMTRAARQPGAGAEMLFAQLATQAGLAPEAVPVAATAGTETEAVQLVARGEADVTLGLETVARDFGLGFVPLVDEAFDLVIDRAAWFEPPLQRLMDFCTGQACARQADLLGGYDMQDFGKVRWNA